MLDGIISKTLLAILTELFGPRESRLHLRELERRTGLKLAGLRRILNELVDKGIVISERSGNRLYFSANLDCPIYPELKMLVTKTSGLADHLRKALDPFSHQIELAYIYGSFADGTADARSDVDLMVVGESSLMDLVQPLSDAGEKVSREINPSTYKPIEYYSELETDGSFIHRVHFGPRIIIIGDADEPEQKRKGREA